MENFLTVMQRAARAGGEQLRKYFGGALEYRQKRSASDFATQADIASEHAVRDVLAKAFPSFNLLGEEGGMQDKGSPYTFVIDPRDGTYNFSVGLPHFSVLVGLMKDEEVIAGVSYDPTLDRMYTAAKGGGAYLNGTRMRVSTVDTLEHAGVTYTCDYLTPRQHMHAVMRALHDAPVKRVFTMWGSGIDFMWLASGRIDACVMDGAELHDFIAVKLIAKEAGAHVTDLSGAPETSDVNRRFLISNGTALHGNLLRVIAQATSVSS